ncbi:MAG: glycosyltransferase [Paludibacteraceae bacterium]|nr:glycosyltransferase [Paludibacteraceae bacterium]MBO7367824.1 glycosyltransferase [Paludibacteraceae bacterium]
MINFQDISNYIQCSLVPENFEPWQIAIFGAFAVAFLIQMCWWCGFFTNLFRYNRKFIRNRVKFNFEQPEVSVIICAKNEEENLKKNLPLIMSQLYPAYEVIVINDASSDDTEMVLAEMKLQYPNLRTTYVPEKAKFVDSKKFAITLGIKAAKNDILVFTDADCIPGSKDWLGNIVRHFDSKTDIVLGYGAYSYSGTLLSRMQVLDTLFIAMQYLNYSLAGKTYMGVGRNMAYRKSMFLKSRGFASHLNLQSGDDDLFINEVATSKNTKVEVQPESRTISEPKATFKLWMRQKERHISTGSFYKAGTKWLIGTEMAWRVLFYGLFIATAVIGNYVTLAIAALMFIVRLLTQYIIIRKSAAVLGEHQFKAGVLLLDICIPLINLGIDLKIRLSGGAVYKWK